MPILLNKGLQPGCIVPWPAPSDCKCTGAKSMHSSLPIYNPYAKQTLNQIINHHHHHMSAGAWIMATKSAIDADEPAVAQPVKDQLDR